MSVDLETKKTVKSITEKYKYGFTTKIKSDKAPKGLNEDIVKLISGKKKEPKWLLDWRLKAFRAWLKMEEPNWSMVKFPKINYQDSYYYSAPKQKKKLKSLNEVDPAILSTYEKLGIPLEEQKRLAGVAVDYVFDSTSVATTFKDQLSKLGIIFCSFSEAVQKNPELIKIVGP